MTIVFKDMIMVISLVVQKVHGNRMVPLDNVGQILIMRGVTMVIHVGR